MPAEFGTHLTREEIETLIPHRENFLFLDEVREVEFGRRGVGIINDVANIIMLEGHFPGIPIMPGALQVASYEQTISVVILGLPEYRGKMLKLEELDKFKFKKPALPGYKASFDSTVINLESGRVRMHGVATSEIGILSEGDLSFAIVPRPSELGG